MIQIQGLTKSFGQKLIFDSIDFQFPAGERLALVGANGVGKTTLLNVICDLEEADSGKVIIPQNVNLGYLPQEPNPKPEATVLAECLAGSSEVFSLRLELARLTEDLSKSSDPELLHRYEEVEANYRVLGGYEIDGKAHSILEGLGFSLTQRQQDPRSLSGGWRMRLELAKLFLSPIDFLILDEPTNHLDLPTLVWVENFLNQFRGTLLFVSHDRALLNRLPTQTLLLFNGKLSSYPYAYNKFLEARQQEREQNLARLENLTKKRDDLQQFVDRFGAKATKARQAQSKAKLIDRIKDQEDEIVIEGDEKTVSIKLPEPPKSARVVCDLDQLSIGYQKPLFKGLDLSIERGQKVAIIGANGIGKSTLLKTLAGKITPLNGEIKLGSNTQVGYFSQNPEDSLKMNQDVLSQVLGVSDRIGEPFARALLGAFLFRGDDVFKKLEVLSGGEKSRVALAKLLVQEANFLLMDEPTNHLDMASVDALVEAIRQYHGTMLFVSHDREFIDSVCTHVFVMLADGRCMLFHGQLEDYEHMAKLQDFPNLLALDHNKPSSDSNSPIQELKSPSINHAEARNLKSKRKTLQKQIDKLESQQSKLTQEIQSIEKEMVQIAADDYQAVYDLQGKMESKQSQLAAIEDEWLGVSNELEDIELLLEDMGRLT